MTFACSPRAFTLGLCCIWRPGQGFLPCSSKSQLGDQPCSLQFVPQKGGGSPFPDAFSPLFRGFHWFPCHRRLPLARSRIWRLSEAEPTLLRGHSSVVLAATCSKDGGGSLGRGLGAKWLWVKTNGAILGVFGAPPILVYFRMFTGGTGF